ncbi:MAG: bifunctional metallophosphatase/5'-nucleotidase [Muribaculaceae bacterium]|nr:bifunctional metallophosphatase/5'-nucleotidase [Muribaculaceae bacterium]
MMLSATAMPAVAEQHTTRIRIIETTDVHGNYYPYDFINRKPGSGSLARVATVVDKARRETGAENVILVDNGDLLQGQPTAYYYNFIDTTSKHVAAEMLNELGYNVMTIGNHEVETGHKVYDRFRSQLNFPMLGANVVATETDRPYLEPYTILERDGLKIAFLGLLTPGIPGWLPETLWEGLRFDEMVPTAQMWVDYIRTNEKPDLIVGLFHSGRDHTKTTGDVVENASMLVAQLVEGLDIVLMGHDHSPIITNVNSPAGNGVMVANAGANADRVADITVEITRDENGVIIDKDIRGKLRDISDENPSAEFLVRFEPQRRAVEAFVGRQIGETTAPMSSRDAYFGSSAFVDFIHGMQLAISGAQISLAAPLTFDATIPAGPITVSDMFNLYKYENMLYTMEMTGQEIKDYLEMAYDLWTNQMTSGEDHLLNFRDTKSADMAHTGFRHPSYNFDSAAGINYTVDVTKPRGGKITIESLSDGSTFDPNATYTVAVNSYRGNGGGNLMTEGAGIAKADLEKRLVKSTDKDLRYYLIQYITEQGKVTPQASGNWRFVPEEIVGPAAERDRKILFGE